MNILLEQTPWLIAMGVLIGLSGFFSSSEAALFSLRWGHQRDMQKSDSAADRCALRLLADPERLLSAVLFWNLVVNMLYFTLVSIVGLRLERQHGAVAAGVFSGASLLGIIFLSEMLPKSLAVLRPAAMSRMMALPLAAAVQALDPLMPVLRAVYVVSRRLIAPNFAPEKLLDTDDLERAVAHSHLNEEVAASEQAALRNLLLLSDLRVEEWMRPRAQFRAFQPPVRLADLDGEPTPSGYLLLTEPEGDEDDIAAAIDLGSMAEIPKGALDRYAANVVYTPWCATVADAMQQMQDADARVAAVVNEYGETIGILTQEDVLETIFTYSPSRSKLLLDTNPIHPISKNHWLVAGVTSLRRLAHMLQCELPPSKSVSIAGALQEHLRRLVKEQDEGEWGPFRFKVLEMAHRGHMVVELELLDQSSDDVVDPRSDPRDVQGVESDDGNNVAADTSRETSTRSDGADHDSTAPSRRDEPSNRPSPDDGEASA